MEKIGDPAQLLSDRLTERQIQKIEQINPRVSREHMMRLVVDAELPAVLQTAVERYGWRHVLELLRELAYKQDLEAEKTKRDGPFRVIGFLLENTLHIVVPHCDLGKKL